MQNPFIKINKWKDAKSIIQGWDNSQIEKKREECILWWSQKKNEIQDQVSSKIKL
jgi:hypothetical protein